MLKSMPKPDREAFLQRMIADLDEGGSDNETPTGMPGSTNQASPMADTNELADDNGGTKSVSFEAK